MTLELDNEVTDWDAVRRNWDELAVLGRGESKDIRIIDDNHVMVRMIPACTPTRTTDQR